jgi:hypothetical protein
MDVLTASSVTTPQTDDFQLMDCLIDGVRLAVVEPGEHRLYRSGKLAGLFPARNGVPAEAAVAALAEGYLEVIRTEERGRWIIEWVRVTPKGVEFVYEHDSPQAVLRELETILGRTRAGLPVWLDDTRQTLEAVGIRFERQAEAMLSRLEALTERVESALRRVDLETTQRPNPTTKLVPWAEAALRYLDRRTQAGALGACPLAELFHALQSENLEMAEFHAGLVRLHESRALKLQTTSGLNFVTACDPEYALMYGAELYSFVMR